jgi:Ni/Co efflux regulator RcnB
MRKLTIAAIAVALMSATSTGASADAARTRGNVRDRPAVCNDTTFAVVRTVTPSNRSKILRKSTTVKRRHEAGRTICPRAPRYVTTESGS